MKPDLFCLGRKDQLSHTDSFNGLLKALITLPICQYGFTCYLEKSDLEKKLQQWVIALNKLQNLACPPHLVNSEHEKRMQTEPRNKDFQKLSCFQYTGDIFFPLSLASVFISKKAPGTCLRGCHLHGIFIRGAIAMIYAITSNSLERKGFIC